MKMKPAVGLTLIILSTILSAQPVPKKDRNKLLFISFDGFRWDYLSKTDTPNFDKLIAQGSMAKQVKNAFSTLTMPNHWTLVTGLYEEDHGIISNSFYDPNYDDIYRFSRDSKWYNATEPIWITAERENIRTGSFMWSGNQAEYDGIKGTKVVPFSSNSDDGLAIYDVINWFKNDGIEFATLYFDITDKTGHSDGPNSPAMIETIKHVDKYIGLLMALLDNAELSSSLNIIIASDHGMTEVSNERSINLGKYVDFKEDVKWSYTSVIGIVWPNDGKHQKVYGALKMAEANETHFTVYNKSDVPDRFHYRDNDRISPIVLVAEPGWSMKKGSYKLTMKGNHGYDNDHPDMKTLMIARGPDFKCGYTQDELQSVDIYPLMCHILGLSTCHSGPGNLSESAAMLNVKQPICFDTPTPSGSDDKGNSCERVQPQSLLSILLVLAIPLQLFS